MIPEFVGRLPVIAPMRSLTRDEIIRVMTEPKNALVRQYQTYFAMEDSKLEFTDDALHQIADIVMERETGVRALRSLFEGLLLDLRYELPSKRETSHFVITKEFVAEQLRGVKPGEGKRETA